MEGDDAREAKRPRTVPPAAAGEAHGGVQAQHAAAAAAQLVMPVAAEHPAYDPSHVTLHPPGHPLSLPEGWLDCPRMGSLCFDLFVPCKVPLGWRFDAVLRDDSVRFSPAQAVEMALLSPVAREIRYLAAVVDLTKTRRYYDPDDLKVEDSRYVKVECSGSDSAPTPLEVNTFCFRVLELLHKPPMQPVGGWPADVSLKPVVLVHCTHGFNRTGAMLVHYAMRMLSPPPREPLPLLPNLPSAVNHFARCRSPGIYKEEYIASLFEYYHEARRHTPCPPRPPWKRVEEGPPPLRDEDVPDDDLWGMDNESYMAVRAKSCIPMPDEEGVAKPEDGGAGHGPPKHDDVLGEEVPPQLRDHVLNVVNTTLGMTGSTDFPGSQPVSLARSNAGLLADLPYMVSWKADGTRYLMLLMHGGAYLIDRAARVRRCQLRLPAPLPAPLRPENQNEYMHYGVVLDGEMVVDVRERGGQPVDRRFLVYDCFTPESLSAVAGVPTKDARFIDRWKAIETAIYGPKKLYEAKAITKYLGAAEPFRLRRKDFWGVERAAWLLNEFIPRQALHPSDGLIFQPQDEPYVARTNEHLLKWKDPRMNSVDFYVHEDASGELLLCVSTGGDGGLKALRDVTLPPSVLADIEASGGASPLDAPLFVDQAEEGTPGLCIGSIAECVWDGQRGGWSLLRVRLDKEHPNHESVFVRVWQSICDNLQAEDVLQLLAPAVAARAAKHAAQAQEAQVAGKRKRDDE